MEKNSMPCFSFSAAASGATFLTASRKGFAWVSWEPMHLQALELEVRKFAGRHLVKRFNEFKVHAEFVFSLPGGDVFVRSRLHIGIDAHGYRSLYSHGRGDGVNGAQFRLRFHIEAVNALFQGVADFRLCFSHAGIGAFPPRP